MNSTRSSSSLRRFALRPFANCQRSPIAIRLLLAVVLIGFPFAETVAQQATGGMPTTPPPTENSDTGPSLGPSGRPFPSSGFLHPLTGHDTNAWIQESDGTFFLPALMPVLGALPPASPVPLAANYPREFAGEPFFMAYGNLVARDLLSAKRTEHIARYRATRLALLTELREQLNRVQDASSGAREQALSAFAAIQTPRLLELEAEAEEIRHDLTAAGMFKTTAHDIGDLSLTNKAPELIDALTSLRLILSAAHFREGFSLDQRRLLDEMALEIQLAIEPESVVSTPAPAFFWPAGARIAVPVGLPPEAAEKFEEFQRRKAALKDELRAALDREANQVFNIDRTDAHARLAAAQAHRFAELDALADQIRPALAALVGAGDPSVAELPDAVSRQVAAIVDRKAALQRGVHTRLVEFRRELPSDRIELIRQRDGLAIAIVTDNSRRRDRESVLSRINTFNGEISTRFAALAADSDAMRSAIARYQATTMGVNPDLTVDQLASDFLAAYKARESRQRQRDYAAAVLAPGLSSAQRRLLLTAASADLLPERLSLAH